MEGILFLAAHLKADVGIYLIIMCSTPESVKLSLHTLRHLLIYQLTFIIDAVELELVRGMRPIDGLVDISIALRV